MQHRGAIGKRGMRGSWQFERISRQSCLSGGKRALLLKQGDAGGRNGPWFEPSVGRGGVKPTSSDQGTEVLADTSCQSEGLA